MKMSLGRILDRVLPHKSIGLNGSEYMRRYFVLGSRGDGDSRRSVRIHHIMRSDDARALHDHPWGFITIGLWGSYTEIRPSSTRTVRAPWIIVHRAEDLHRLVLDRPVWTLVFTGRRTRDWGFMVGDEWVGWERFTFLADLHLLDVGDARWGRLTRDDWRIFHKIEETRVLRKIQGGVA